MHTCQEATPVMCHSVCENSHVARPRYSKGWGMDSLAGWPLPRDGSHGGRGSTHFCDSSARLFVHSLALVAQSHVET